MFRLGKINIWIELNRVVKKVKNQTISSSIVCDLIVKVFVAGDDNLGIVRVGDAVGRMSNLYISASKICDQMSIVYGLS